MSITGDLTEVKLFDLVQLICTERQTARLRARSGYEEASIYVARGEVVHARLGTRTGAEALYEALAWESGTFKLDKGVQTAERTVDEKWAPLLLEGLARIEAQRADLGLASEGLLDTPAADGPAPATAGPGAVWGPRLEALPEVTEVVIITKAGLGMSYASSSRAEDEGALAAFVGNFAGEIGEALALGELRRIRMVIGGDQRLVLGSRQGFVGLRLARGSNFREVSAAASKIIARGA